MLVKRERLFNPYVCGDIAQRGQNGGPSSRAEDEQAAGVTPAKPALGVTTTEVGGVFGELGLFPDVPREVRSKEFMQ